MAKEHKITDNSLAGTFTCKQCAFAKSCNNRQTFFRGKEVYAQTIRCTGWKKA